MYNQTMTLSNGIVVPQLALGTWMIQPDDKAAEAVRTALELGYRHIDTAQAYGNERGVGDGIRGSGIPREQIFVTSKVEAEHKSYAAAAASIDESLIKLGLDYIDLMLIHSPQPWEEVNQSDNRYIEGNRQVWKALEDALGAGKLRSIGVSNFLIEDVENLWPAAEIKPMVNQVLCHISNTPLELIQYCQNKGIVVEAYSPVAHGEALKNEKIAAMAEKYGVSVPQLCIRYDLQLGMIVLPKTVNPEHMKANAAVDFVISDQDMEILKNMEKIKDYGEHSSFAVFGGKYKER
ncbi:2,5-diketo-D-gluconic acid reductase [Lachnospiraceae bacterium oral taxon 500]|nr:2,5-diketo-D-gluconic acid reductase [Lachnospiraceae bacterium oral taxon 500]